MSEFRKLYWFVMDNYIIDTKRKIIIHRTPDITQQQISGLSKKVLAQ